MAHSKVRNVLIALLFVPGLAAAQPEVNALRVFVGTAGSTCTVRSGTGVPATSLGTVCDVYLRKDAPYTIYVKDGATTWTPTLSMPAGATTGDVITAATASSLGRIPDVATGQVLASAGVGVAPNYTATPTLTSVTAPLFTNTGALSITTSTGNATIAPAGDIIFNPTGNDLLPTTPYDLNIGMISNKFLTLHVAELWVETLVAQSTIATIGGRILVGPTTVLTSDLLSTDTSVIVKHNQMANGDRVYMEADSKIEFMAITSGPTSAGGSPAIAAAADTSSGNATATAAVSLGTGAVGDLVVCDTAWFNTTFTSIVASPAATFAQIGTEQTIGSNQGRTYYSTLSSAGALTVTLTVASSSATYPAIACSRSNGATGWALDKTAVTSTATTATSGSSGATATRVGANQWLIGTMWSTYGGGAVTLNPGTNLAWITDAEHESGSNAIPIMIEHVGVSSVGTQGAEWTSSVAIGSSTRIATFTYSGAGGPYTYTVTRNLDGTVADNWYAGDAVFNTGTTGDGFIDLYSVSAVNGPTVYGPSIVGNVRTGTTYSQIAPRWAIGNLNGVYGYGTDIYGAAFGDASAANLVIDATNGIRFRNSTTSTMELTGSTLNLMNTGVIKSGSATALSTGTGLWIAANSGTPQLRVGNPAGDYLQWNGTNLSIVSQYFSVDANGVTIIPGVIYSDSRAYRFTTTTGRLGMSGTDPGGGGRTVSIDSVWTGVGNYNLGPALISQLTASNEPSSGGTAKYAGVSAIVTTVAAPVASVSIDADFTDTQDLRIYANNGSITTKPYIRSDGNYLVIESRSTANGGAIYLGNDSSTIVYIGTGGGQNYLYNAHFTNAAPRWADALTQLTVGAAGTATALPANPAAYIKIASAAGTVYVVPVYNP